MIKKDFHEECIRKFLKELAKVSPSYETNQVFKDACRIMSLSLRGVVAQGKEKEGVENEYQSFVKKYGENGMKKIAGLLAIVVDALEECRTDFLGQVYERLNATVKKFGQFLTPIAVSELMAKIVFSDKIKNNEIVRMYDPTCGAGVLLLEGADKFMDAGGKQRNLLIYADDLDDTACCIAYVQFSLLGYAAIVRRINSLSLEVFEGPWYTIGYFLHAFPMRLLCQKALSLTTEEKQKVQEEKQEKTEAEDAVNLRSLVQGELF